MAPELTEAQKIEKSLKRDLYFCLPLHCGIFGWHTDSARSHIKNTAKVLKTLEELEGPTPQFKDIQALFNYYQHKSDDAVGVVNQTNYRY
jgi:hypothetical protein